MAIRAYTPFKFVCKGQGHRSKNVEKAYSRNVKLPSAITPVHIKHTSTKFAYSVGISAMVDRMVWPPSLSRGLKCTCATNCSHSRVVGYWIRRQSCSSFFCSNTDWCETTLWNYYAIFQHTVSVIELSVLQRYGHCFRVSA